MKELHIVFGVAGTEYAVPASAVIMMESFTGATAVPGVPVYVEGLMTVRGRVVPVVDLRVLFGFEREAPTLNTRVVVVEWRGRTVALRADVAREVRELDTDQMQPAPDMAGGQAHEFVRGLSLVGQRLILVIDLGKVLGEKRQSHDNEPRGILEQHEPLGRRALSD
jgi:purine-binding chemotaxis protein CheW